MKIVLVPTFSHKWMKNNNTLSDWSNKKGSLLQIDQRRKCYVSEILVGDDFGHKYRWEICTRGSKHKYLWEKKEIYLRHKYRWEICTGVHTGQLGRPGQKWLNIVDSEPEIPWEESPTAFITSFHNFYLKLSSTFT